MKGFLREIARRDPLLWWTGVLNLGLGVLFVVGLVLDERVILGLNTWVKPLKFALSITIYVWTVAWLLGEVSARAPWSARIISFGTSLAMLSEIACIALQSWRGVPSHFNQSTSFDIAIFAFMGIMILLNTILAGGLLLLFFVCTTGLRTPQLWAVRLGLVILLLGSAIGGQMVSHRAHAVGVPDGGPGLPFVNWSTEGGDLRVAHALGLHALQILPLAAFVLGRRTRLSESRQTLAVFALAGALALIWGATLALALLGRPLVPY